MGMAAILVNGHDRFRNFSFHQPKEAPYEIWAQLAQGLQWRSHLKMLLDRRMHGWTDGRKVITIAHSEHRWASNKWVHSAVPDGFQIPFRSTPSILAVLKSLASSLLLWEEISELLQKWAVKRLQDPGSPSFHSQNLRPIIDLSLVSQYIRKQPFKMESQVSTTIDIGQRLDWLHRPDRCLPICYDSPTIQEISLVHVWRSALPIHSLTLRIVPKSVDFYQTDGRNSIALVSI